MFFSAASFSDLFDICRMKNELLDPVIKQTHDAGPESAEVYRLEIEGQIGPGSDRYRQHIN
ncbi:MAG: hypothetical protein MI861_28280 [Pirellulales bacterium]|nr:hypothetical protein [Pirellulales bacterium]